jgi:hypothetical protein
VKYFKKLFQGTYPITPGKFEVGGCKLFQENILEHTGESELGSCEIFQ